MLYNTIENNEGRNNMINKRLIVLIKTNGDFEIDWDMVKGKSSENKLLKQEEIFNDFKKNKYLTIYKLGLIEEKSVFSGSIEYLINLSQFFIKKLSKDPLIEFTRENIKLEINFDEINDLINKAPFMLGIEHLNDIWFMNFFNKLKDVFAEEIINYNGSVESYFEKFNKNIHLVGRIFFHLVENKDGEVPFAFLATYSTFISESGKEKHLPLRNAVIEYKKDNKKMLKLLSTVNRAAERSEFISELVENGEIFHPLKLSAEEAYIFLKEIPLYEESGILCRIPKWWKNRLKSVKMEVTIGDIKKSKLNFDAIVDFNSSLQFAGEDITEDEIRKLLLEAEGLSFIKGKWVEVDHKKLKETLEAYEKAQEYSKKGGMTVLEAMRFELDINKTLEINDENIDLEITNGKWLNSIVTRLGDPNTIKNIDTGKDFNASLRYYQEKGLNWLYFMKKLGLGACLADDMGLGKTVQVIALLNHMKNANDKKEKSLIVLPVSLIGNWIAELNKFAPNLKYFVIHKSKNKLLVDDDSQFIKNYDVYITSYGMLNKYEWISNVTWDNLILDEAQAIKNPGTKRTKTVKKLKAKYKVAMTGTPIENRLGDLWSLFDFLNAGLLGSSKEFKNLSKNLIKKHGDYSKLKHVVNPFILRRLKTDKTIISDLPEKIEMKAYASLSKKQTVLYNKLVNDLVKVMENEDGIKRKGIILSSIMKFKQICNHPDQYLGQSAYLEKESGKFKRLREIAEEIYEKRERVIVFTQFREMTSPLKIFLESIFGHKGYVLHGGTKINKRQEIVDSFQGEDYVPFIVLSIKAGGVGLNLTKANHVVHFDRWWNPAVENQATDRAFRIGQKKNVVVHKFITEGTIEEKIDLMIEEKEKLSSEIISAEQTNSITEMNNEEILNLFKLRVE